MKSLKQFRKEIDEAYGMGAKGGNDQYGATVPHVDGPLTFSGNPELVARINQYIGRQLQREFTDVTSCFNMLRAKLNVLGLDFTTNASVKSEGKIEFPMTRHGGAFGTTPEHDLNQGFYDENGFDGNIDHALVGEVTYGENGGIRIEARIEAKDVD